ncbi:hypothetical protein LIER_38883 [Lithospermum erythrorhizon]|uniref:Uncharacterized protein n=1 Tax=Lithospermum erythrorhizon TaxID=34254 RepID=A0AAV3Q7F6_LITER
MSGGSNQEISSTSNQQEAVVGAEFTIGNLKFSKDHDPFANIAIPQDVAREVASRLNDEDTGGNLLDADAISAEPLSIRHPSNSATNSSQAHTTPSSSQTAGPTQADTNDDKPGDIPTVIRDSLPVAFSDEDLVNFSQYFSIPSTVEMRIPLEGEQIFEPLVDPSHSDGPLAPVPILRSPLSF